MTIVRLCRTMVAVNLTPNLARALEAQGWTQARLARALGKSRSTVNEWIHGTRPPSLPMLKRIAELLETSVHALIGEDAAPDPLIPLPAADEASAP